MTSLPSEEFTAEDFRAVANWLLKDPDSLSTPAIEGVLGAMHLRLDTTMCTKLSHTLLNTLTFRLGEDLKKQELALLERIDELQNWKVGTPLRNLVIAIIAKEKVGETVIA